MTVLFASKRVKATYYRCEENVEQGGEARPITRPLVTTVGNVLLKLPANRVACYVEIDTAHVQRI